MSSVIENKCIKKGVRLTDQRKLIAQVMSESTDHPDVDELHKRVSKIDIKISIATVYRTVKLFEEAGIVAKHDFKGNKARYEEATKEHHDHLIDVNTGEKRIFKAGQQTFYDLMMEVKSTMSIDGLTLNERLSKMFDNPDSAFQKSIRWKKDKTGKFIYDGITLNPTTSGC